MSTSPVPASIEVVPKGTMTPDDIAVQRDTPAGPREVWFKRAMLALLVTVVVLVVIDAFTGKLVGTATEDFLLWLRDTGVGGVLLFIGVYIVFTVAFIPGSLLTIGAGFAFTQAFNQGTGVLVGSLAVFVGATTGSICAFLIGRYLLHDTVKRWAHRFPVLFAIDKVLEGKGLRLVVLLRLSPVIPFNAFNYAMGVTSVTFRDFLLGHFGMIPGTVAFVYLGSLLSDVRDMSSDEEVEESEDAPAVRWTIFGVGLAATIAVVVFVSVYARKQLSAALESGRTDKAARSALSGKDSSDDDVEAAAAVALKHDQDSAGAGAGIDSAEPTRVQLPVS